jgi:hypothetical protein
MTGSGAVWSVTLRTAAWGQRQAKLQSFDDEQH